MRHLEQHVIGDKIKASVFVARTGWAINVNCEKVLVN